MFLFKVILMPVKSIRSPPEERIVLNPQKAGNGHFSCISSPADTWQKGGSASKKVQANKCMLECQFYWIFFGGHFKRDACSLTDDWTEILFFYFTKLRQ